MIPQRQRSDHGERTYVNPFEWLLCKFWWHESRRDGHDRYWCIRCGRDLGGV